MKAPSNQRRGTKCTLTKQSLLHAVSPRVHPQAASLHSVPAASRQAHLALQRAQPAELVSTANLRDRHLRDARPACKVSTNGAVSLDTVPNLQLQVAALQAGRREAERARSHVRGLVCSPVLPLEGSAALVLVAHLQLSSIT